MLFAGVVSVQQAVQLGPPDIEPDGGIAPPNLWFDAAYAYDMTADAVLYKKDQNTPYPIYSLTKLLCALTALDYVSGILSTEVTIVDDDIIAFSANIGVANGDILSYEELLRASVTAECGYCVTALARSIGDLIQTNTGTGVGGVPRFMDAVNAKAFALEAYSFEMTNPGGYIQGENLGSARHMYKVLKAAYDNTTVRGWAGATSGSVTVTGPSPRTINYTPPAPLYSGRSGIVMDHIGYFLPSPPWGESNFLVVWTAPNGNQIAIIGLHNEAAVNYSLSDMDAMTRHLARDYTYLDPNDSLRTADTNWSSVKLMLGADTNPIVDESTSAHTLTLSNVTRESTNRLMGTHSILFGSTGYIEVPYSDDWRFGNGAFTIEAYFRWDNNGVLPTTFACLLCAYDESVSGHGFFWHYNPTNNRFQFAYSTNGSNLWDGGFINPAQQVFGNGSNHIAVIRSGNTISHYLNGGFAFSQNVASNPNFFNHSRPLLVGALRDGTGVPVQNWPGLIDEVRITKGVARSVTGWGVGNALPLRGPHPRTDGNVARIVGFGTQTITGYEPEVTNFNEGSTNINISVAARTLSVTGYAPTVSASSNVNAGAQTQTMTGRLVSVSGGSDPVEYINGFVNLGAEDGMNNWAGSGISSGTKGGVTPQEGAAYFYMPDGNNYMVVTQTAPIDSSIESLVAAGAVKSGLSFYGYGGDGYSQGSLYLEFYDVSDTQVAFIGGDFESAPAAWTLFDYGTVVIPATTTYAVLTISLYDAYVGTNVFLIDDVQVPYTEHFPAIIGAFTGFTNLDAETGNASGWTNVAGTLLVRDGGTGGYIEASGTGGTYYFYCSGTDAHATQVANVDSIAEAPIDAELQYIRLTWESANDQERSETARAYIEFLDAADTVLGILDSFEHSTAYRVWKTNSLEGKVPPNTRKLRLGIQWINSGGVSRDYYFDNIQVDWIDSPTALFYEPVNLDAESGTFGWKIDAGTPRSGRYSSIAPFAGIGFFMGISGTNVQLSQTRPFTAEALGHIASNARIASLDFYERGFDSTAKGWFYVEYFDIAGDPIATRLGPASMSTPTNSWTLRSFSEFIPSDAHSYRLVYYGERLSGSGTVDYYVDSIIFTHYQYIE